MNDATVEKNITLAFRHAQEIVADPAILATIPDGATLVLIPDDDPELASANLQLGIDAVHRGEDVYLRHVRVG